MQQGAHIQRSIIRHHRVLGNRVFAPVSGLVNEMHHARRPVAGTSGATGPAAPLVWSPVSHHLGCRDVDHSHRDQQVK